MFLHGDPKEEIYMKEPEGFIVKGKKEPVCKLKESLYGLKQSPRMQYQNFDTYTLGLGFVRSKVDHYVVSKFQYLHCGTTICEKQGQSLCVFQVLMITMCIQSQLVTLYLCSTIY
jgi:hypothetical protein